MTGRRLAMVGLGAFATVILLCIAFVDQPLATWSHAALHRPVWCVWLTWIADAPAPLATLGILGCLAAWLAGWRPGMAGRLLIGLCLATLAADAAKDVLKLAFGRPWPETWVNNNPSWIGTGTYGFFPFHGGAGWASFPSGHTTSIAAPCAFLCYAVPRLRAVWLALPSLVVVGLLGCDYHFLSDCVAGAGLGAAIAVAALALI